MREFDFLDFGRFLCANSLELDGGALVTELGHEVPQIKLNAILLGDVVKCQFNDNLTESWVLFGLFNGDWRPYHIDDLGRIALFIRFFADVPQRQRDPQALFRRRMLLLLLLRRRLLLKWVYDLMTCHVDEHFSASFDVFGFDDEALGWLDGRAAFGIDQRFAVDSFARGCISLHFLKHLGHFRTHLSRLDSLVKLHKLRITVLI